MGNNEEKEKSGQIVSKERPAGELRLYAFHLGSGDRGTW
jgi:hypothetical protein